MVDFFRSAALISQGDRRTMGVRHAGQEGTR